MSGLWRLVLLVCLVLAASQTLARPVPLLGYVAWWLGDAWQSAPLEAFERVVFVELKIDQDGSVRERNGWPEQWQALRNRVRDAGRGVDLSLALAHETDFASVFASASARRKLLRECARLLRHPDVAGLHLDIEVYREASSSQAALAGFREVVRTLSRRAQRSGRWQLSVFLPMGGEFDLYTRDELEKVSLVVVQSYDAHWLEGPRAGPVAPLNGDGPVTWRKSLDLARALGVDDHRVFLSFPLYGYEWPVRGQGEQRETTGPGRVVPYAPLPAALRASFPSSVLERVTAFGGRFHPDSASGSYRFDEAGQAWEGWFEDGYSIQAKRRWLDCAGGRGMAVFALGYDAGLLVESLASPVPQAPACAPAADKNPLTITPDH